MAVETARPTSQTAEGYSDYKERKLTQAVIHAAMRFREHGTDATRFALFEALDAFEAFRPGGGA